LIIVLMAVDHASYFIARVHPLEIWSTPPPYYADTLAFLTRWLTHLCAPGFFMLMGIGIVYFAESRVAAGWSAGRITRFLATRGMVLLVVQHVLENPAWLIGSLSIDSAVEATMPMMPGPGGELMLGFAVLSALGVAMMVGSLLWRAPTWLIGAFATVVLLTTRNITPDPSTAFDPQSVWMQLLFIPGHTGILQNLYPWVPWLIPMAVGLAIAREIRRSPLYLTRDSLAVGLFMVAAFGAIQWLRVNPLEQGVIGWLTVTKYPPSDAFFAVTLGLNMLLLWGFFRWPARWLTPLEVFGRTPFFFYLAHLWIFSALSWFFPMGTSFGVMYLVWAVVVAALYPMCARYAQFKFSKPATSLWRLF
jgi:uncharacterized membrane protein